VSSAVGAEEGRVWGEGVPLGEGRGYASNKLRYAPSPEKKIDF